jgi:phosphoglycerate kinase
VTLVLDIGTKIIADLSRVIHGARAVVFNGPAGVFEDTDFATGTFELIKAASQVEFSVVGGGHTAAVVEKLGLDHQFTHISTGGGACIEFLTGRKLPAVEALEQSKTVFG